MFAIILIVIVSVAVVALLTFEIVGLIRQIKENRAKKNGKVVENRNPTLNVDDETIDDKSENKEE